MVVSWNTGQAGEDAVPAMPETIRDLPARAGPPPAGLSGEQDLRGPPVVALPQQERPLGRRVAAALLDLVLLGGLFVILSMIIGQTSQAAGPVSISLGQLSFTDNGQFVFGVGLDGAWAVLYLAVVPTYYFALEASAGQTVGKCLLGLRVLRSDGGRAPAAAIAWRTLFRLIDGLPVLYLAGFITMLATGRRRRQRLGDLAAGTTVTRAQPAPARGLALSSLVLVLLAAAGLSAYRAAAGAGAQTYRAHGVSFSYPAGWREVNGTFSVHRGTMLWRILLAPEAPPNAIAVEEYQVSTPVSAGNLAAVGAQVERLLRQVAGQEGGTVLAGPQPITMAGLPGLRFLATGALSDGTNFDSTLIFAFAGTTEYFVNCQYNLAAAAEVQDACDQVIATFRVAPPPAQAWPARHTST